MPIATMEITTMPVDEPTNILMTLPTKSTIMPTNSHWPMPERSRLMTDAKLYLADEPTLGLAPKIGMAVMSALLAIDLKDSAMFIAEQNVALLEGRVDRIIGMHAGKLKGEASSSFNINARL